MATMTTSSMRERPTTPNTREILRCRTVKDPVLDANATASPAELRKALSLLDLDGDGKVDDDDVDVLMQLALGVDARNSEGTWQAVKAACACTDGKLELTFLLKMVGTDTFNKAISQMNNRPSEALLFPFTSVVDFIQVFQDFDRDRNGLICATDLQLVIKDGIVAVPRHHCKEIIRRVDPESETGVVNLLNFGKLIQLITSADLCSADVKHTL